MNKDSREPSKDAKLSAIPKRKGWLVLSSTVFAAWVVFLIVMAILTA